MCVFSNIKTWWKISHNYTESQKFVLENLFHYFRPDRSTRTVDTVAYPGTRIFPVYEPQEDSDRPLRSVKNLFPEL